MAELVLQMLSATKTLELPIDHDGQAVAEGFTLLHAVRGEYDGLAVLLNGIDNVPQLPPGDWINSGAWLIQENDLKSEKNQEMKFN